MQLLLQLPPCDLVDDLEHGLLVRFEVVTVVELLVQDLLERVLALLEQHLVIDLLATDRHGWRKP